MWSLAAIAAAQGLAGHYDKKRRSQRAREKQANLQNKATERQFEYYNQAKNIKSSTRDQLRSIRSETPGGLGKKRTNFGFGGTGNWLDFYRPENQKKLQNEYQERRFKQDSRQYDQNKRGLPRPIIGGMRPPRDTIAMMYENILGRKADQEGLDYWRSELESGRQTRDDIRQNIIRSDEFQGRSEADREAALRGVEQRRSIRRQIRRGKPPRGKFNPAIHHRDGGFRGKGGGLGGAAIAASQVLGKSLRGKGRARPTGKKPTGRGLFPSIAAAMAARGGF